jgi:glycosyltransferase involved in cell wall biosynthesis
MRIGINARPLGMKRTGTGNYVYGLAQSILRTAPQHEYFLYSNREISLPVAGEAYHERLDPSFGWCPGSFWCLARVGGLLERDKVDVFWSTSTILPVGIGPSVLKVITVYDLVWRRFPETMASYTLWIHRIFAERAIARADRIVVISGSTGEELAHSLRVPKEKIRVVYPRVSSQYRPHDQSAAAEYISAKYRVGSRYIATVGTVEPRKNIKLLVDVIRILKRKGSLDCPILVVGARGWKNSQLFRQIQEASLTGDDIRFLGYMPDEDLPFFYAGAQLFLFPSLYEGFGFPPVEAMASGTPVIASNAQCMPEILGNAAILESCTNAERFAAAITYVLSNASVREEMRAKGIRRSQRFQGESSTQQLLGVFEEGELCRLRTCPSSLVV